MQNPKIDELNKILENIESQNLEYKEAKTSYSRSNILKYCAALSNEEGGMLMLGVNDSRKIVGTDAFRDTYNTLQIEILNVIGIRVNIDEIIHPEGRVLVFNIPKHPIGRLIKYQGRYLMRVGESLTDMNNDTLLKKLSESEPDFSSQIVKGLNINQLDREVINKFKMYWAKKSNRKEYLTFPIERTLRNIGVLNDDGIKYAGLILFGRKDKIDEFLPCDEIIFEWRQSSSKTSHDYRKIWREPFFKVFEEIWEAIDSKNIRFPFQQGLFQNEIYAFSEKAIREALLNAVAHRDYRINGKSIIIKSSPEEFYIESPGGLPGDVTIDNILDKTFWRNRLIAEIFEKAGLVERSGQGMNDIFYYTIKEGKGIPDLSKSDFSTVRLRIPAKVKDSRFILFIDKVLKEEEIDLSVEEIYELEKIRFAQELKDFKFKDKFLKHGIIERIGRTKGSKYILSHKYYKHQGKIGIHTKLTGLNRITKKELIIKHLTKNPNGYLKDLTDAFDDIDSRDITNLLQELKRAGRIEFIGANKTGYWKLKK